MAMFNGYVSLPEGNHHIFHFVCHFQLCPLVRHLHTILPGMQNPMVAYVTCVYIVPIFFIHLWNSKFNVLMSVDECWWLNPTKWLLTSYFKPKYHCVVTLLNHTSYSHDIPTKSLVLSPRTCRLEHVRGSKKTNHSHIFWVMRCQPGGIRPGGIGCAKMLLTYHLYSIDIAPAQRCSILGCLKMESRL